MSLRMDDCDGFIWLDGHHYQAGPVARALMADFQELVRQPDCEGFGEATHLFPAG